MSQTSSSPGPFSYKNFRCLWSSSLCAYGAMWIQAATLSWLAYDITGSATMVGAILAVRVIPLLSLAPISGVAADRYDRRKILQFAQWLSAGSVFVFGTLLWFDLVQTWMLFAFTIILGAGNVIDRPSRHSTVFEVVPREIAPKAVAYNVMGNSSMRVLGPAIAGLLIAAIGAAGNFFIQSALYLASGLLAYLVVFPPKKPKSTAVSAWGELKQGFRYVASDRTTRMLMSITAIQYFLLVPVFNTLFPVYAKDIYKVGPEGLGLMFTFVGVGGVIGAATASMLMRLDRIGMIQTGAMLVYCTALVGLALSSNFYLALAMCSLAGAAEMVNSVNNQTMLQLSAPPEMRGRVVSLIQLNPALIASGSLIAGALGDFIGAPGACMAVSAVSAFLVLAMLIASPFLRSLRLSQYR
ncbi:MAG: MFS transporter [Betaproteobacteria bacterium]|nr:MFS transporter [Betaproteobacteria bacterium]